MKSKTYSAGMVKTLFWFSEFRKVVHFINRGKTLNEIKALNLVENIFAAPTERRAIQIYNTVSGRVKNLDPCFYPLFEASDISTQKMIALIAVMQTDQLFFEFMYEVYREKLVIGSNELTDSDVRVFFKDKQLQSDKVASWTDYTLKKLGSAYKSVLMDAGVVDRSTGNKRILKPILDQKLEECLKSNGMDLMIHALTGVR